MHFSSVPAASAFLVMLFMRLLTSGRPPRSQALRTAANWKLVATHGVSPVYFVAAVGAEGVAVGAVGDFVAVLAAGFALGVGAVLLVGAAAALPPCPVVSAGAAALAVAEGAVSVGAATDATGEGAAGCVSVAAPALGSSGCGCGAFCLAHAAIRTLSTTANETVPLLRQTFMASMLV